MMSRPEWQEANSLYLTAALAWLRLRARARAPVVPPVSASSPATAPADTTRTPGLKKSRPAADPLTEAVDELERIAASMQPPPALLLLGERLGLSPFERNVLLLAIASELEGDISTASEDQPLTPSFATAMHLFEDAAWDALSPERPLRFWRLLEFHSAPRGGLLHSTFSADERAINFCRGLNHLDERLSTSLSDLPIPLLALDLPASQQGAVASILTSWHPSANSPPPLIQLLGSDSASKQMVALQAAVAIGRRLYRLAADALPSSAADLLALSRLWQRESRLTPVALYIDVDDLEFTDADPRSALRRLLAHMEDCTFLATREPFAGHTGPVSFLRIAKPTAAEQRDLWSAALPKGSAAPPVLAGQFNLNVAEIQQILDATHPIANSLPNSTDALLWERCREHTQPRLDLLAKRLDAKATWDDLVLPRAELDLLHQIAAQVSQRSLVYESWGFAARMNRGLGITALFAGESGTGKTMAAEVLANELRLALYRIDLSAVVSKYIGETEKNLRRLFDAAEDGGSILFFDEADALFGKRSEVRDSHDRYANIEVNYLLQRMEAFRGLAILATNMRSSLDTAFTRRLRFMVTLPFPGIADRRAMWQKAFPPETPTEKLDYARLARLNLTGGNIHSAAVNAAFLAANRNSPVTMAEALTAARNELLKLDHPIVESDFHWSLAPQGVA